MSVNRTDIIGLQALFEQLRDAKRRGTQSEWPEVSVAEWNFNVDDESGFTTFVSDCYKTWRETCRADIKYLLSVQQGTSDATVCWTFDRVVYLLRTAAQHSDATDAVKFAGGWRQAKCGFANPSSPEAWQQCLSALVQELVQALIALHSITFWIMSDTKRQQAWRLDAKTRLQLDPRSLQTKIVADLGLAMRDDNFEFVARNVAGRWDRIRFTSRDDAESILEHLVERQVMGVSLPKLPCSYQTVLERVDGWADAVACLCLAHGLAGLRSWTTVDDFLVVLEAAWDAAKGLGRDSA